MGMMKWKKLKFKANKKGEEDRYMIITIEGSEEDVNNFFRAMLTLFPTIGIEVTLLEVDEGEEG